jgi:TPR repeat protein
VESASPGDDKAAGSPVGRADVPPDRLADAIMPPVAVEATAKPDGETRTGFADLPPDRAAEGTSGIAAGGDTATRQEEATTPAVFANVPPDRLADDTPAPAVAADAGPASAAPVVAAAYESRPTERAPERPAASQDLAALLARGDAMLELGDVVAARLFYQRAASLGSARGATALGKTYDPVFLAAVQATGITADRKLAAGWYRKGAALGDAEGSRRLAVLMADR